MPKYLLSGSYSTEGLKGLQKEKASGRLQAARSPSISLASIPRGSGEGGIGGGA
jgi:hypothetical protein